MLYYDSCGNDSGGLKIVYLYVHSQLVICHLLALSPSEYLAVFKKTVQVHEVFLQRLSSHPILSKDRNFQIFLEYDQDVSLTLGKGNEEDRLRIFQQYCLPS